MGIDLVRQNYSKLFGKHAFVFLRDELSTVLLGFCSQLDKLKHI